jgi:deferrochelatase/peroxidase EfeB
MSEPILALPLPQLDSKFQPGVTDPVWPATAPANVDRKIYEADYAGQLARQRYLHIVTANVSVSAVGEMSDVLHELSWFAHHQEVRDPEKVRKADKALKRPYDRPIENPRVTVTVGYGATLFTNRDGDDRFGWASFKPTWLKIIPSFPGDDRAFSPRASASDLIILLASDDAYVNEYLLGLLYYGIVHKGIKVIAVERGYARPDSREPGGFEDGSSNPRGGAPNSKMNHFVYVAQGDDEPEWCVDGTYLAYRKIQRRLAEFFQLSPEDQQKLMGAYKNSGDLFPKAPPESHKCKVNPRREAPDLFGINDDDRQILRRPYFYDDGLDATRQELRGVHHLSFMRNLGMQYEWRVQMWEMNSQFPGKNCGADLMYSAKGGASNVGGGYYFVPGLLEHDLRSPLGTAHSKEGRDSRVRH